MPLDRGGFYPRSVCDKRNLGTNLKTWMSQTIKEGECDSQKTREAVKQGKTRWLNKVKNRIKNRSFKEHQDVSKQHKVVDDDKEKEKKREIEDCVFSPWWMMPFSSRACPRLTPSSGLLISPLSISHDTNSLRTQRQRSVWWGLVSLSGNLFGCVAFEIVDISGMGLHAVLF